MNLTHAPSRVCVFITAGPSTKLFAYGGTTLRAGQQDTRDSESRSFAEVGLATPTRGRVAVIARFVDRTGYRTCKWDVGFGE
jgi:hypothetical protein